MGVLIVAGTVTLAVLLAGRLGGGSAPPRTVSLGLAEGARIASISSAGDDLALLIEGDGPARVVLWDVRRGALAGILLPR
jgi:hypothetical protein